MQEEIFGPILPIVNAKNVGEAVAFINNMEKPLALYVFSNDKKVHDFFLRNTSSGNLVINETMMHFSCSSLPFGGIGNSGMGAYHGKFTFDTFSHSKGTLIKNLNKFGEYLSAARYPPFNDNKLNFISTMTKKRDCPRIPYLSHILALILGIFIAFIAMYYMRF